MDTKLVIFDYDGVLVDSFSMLVDVYNRYAKEFNIPIPKNKSYYHRFFELNWKNCLKKWNINSKKDHLRCTEIYEDIVSKNHNKIRLHKDIKNLLITLEKQYTLAICTNNSASHLNITLDRLGIISHFSLILGSEHGKPKPDPDLIFQCLKQLNFSSEESVFIGDMDGDIIAAKKAGLKKAIAVTYGFHKKNRLKDADILINKPLDLIGAVK